MRERTLVRSRISKACRRGQNGADAVIHTAFDHDCANYAANCEKDSRAITALGAALRGSERPLIVMSTTVLGDSGNGEPALEAVFNVNAPIPSVATEKAARAVLASGVDVRIIRLPQVHDECKQGLITFYIGHTRLSGLAAFVDKGDDRWSAAHITDVAKLFAAVRQRGARGENYHAVLGVLDADRHEPAGTIRINAHHPAAVYVVMPRLAHLAAIAPRVMVELVVNDGMVDIVAERFDCGIRHEGKLQQDMIALRISDPIPLIFVASAAYVAARGLPDGPGDLANHRCVVYRHTSPGAVHRWELEHEGRRIERSVVGAFATNDVDLRRDAVLAGLGIGCLLRSQAEPFLASGALVEVLPGQAPPLPANYLYYPSRRQPTAAFRAFLEVMRR